jgi:hypothetical protein
MLGRASSAPRSNERLSERRRTRRRRALISLFILLLLLLSAAVYGLQQGAVRISHVEVFGADASLATFATDAMQGWYFGIIPRDSIFFFPESRIRTDILAAHEDIAAISIFRGGLTSLSIKIDSRAPIARWCGLAPTAGVNEYCYIFDANGFIYAAAATTTETVNAFTLYALLAGDALEPLRATIANADKLPAVFDFARQLTTLGSPVSFISIHNGEVDNQLTSGTRITYVLGNEQNAFTALISARENLNLADGSFDYVDLRFDGKVYLKRKE